MDNATNGSGGTDETLLERVGGASAVIDTLKILYDRLFADELIAPFLAGVDAQVLLDKQYDFLGRMLEASEYDPERLRAVHQQLVDDGLSDVHFDGFLAHMRVALVEAEVPDDCVEEVIDAFETTRDDILCR